MVATVAARVPYIYVLGAGHSGSTLLTLLLARHPAICSVGEVKAPAIGPPADYPCSCGQRILACDFWRALARDVDARGAHLDITGGATDIRRAPTPYLRALMKPLHRTPGIEALRDAALALSPGWRRHLRRFHAVNTALARAACALTGKAVFLDSSKTGLQLKYLLGNANLDVKVIRLVRDGRGVSLSYRTSEGFTFADGAYAWRRANEESEALVASLPRDRWFDLGYERLCADVRGTLAEVFTFIGVDPGAPLADGAPHHVLGNNKARMKTDEVRLDERWRRELNADDLAAFERVAGAMNRRFGYAT